jgi:peptidoglycan/LPS O-acetylase OafA/YrhL
MANGLTYRADLQLLRGISLLLIFFYHLKIPGFQNGFLGVDVFFVLSGFFMAIIVNKVGLIEFYIRRLKRLLPAYLVVILFASLAVIAIALPVDAKQRLDKIFYDLAGLSNFIFWAGNSYFSSAAFKPLLNIWSLAVEFQFYLLAPFMLPFLRKRILIFSLIIIISLMFSILMITVSPKTSFFMLPTRLWEFLLGAYAAWFRFENIKKKTLNTTLLLAVSSLITVIFFYPLPNDSLSILTGHPSIAALIVAFSTAVIVALGLNKIFTLESKLSKILIKLGDYSYSVYLVHFPIIVLVNYRAFGGVRLGYENISQLFEIIFLTIVFSYFLYNYIEKLRYSNNVFSYIFLLILICFLLGIFGNKLNRLAYNKNELLIFNAWEDRAVYRCGKLSRIFNPISRVCLIGDDLLQDNRVLLLGNSHADSIKTSFHEIMEYNGITTFFYVHNNPLMSSSQSEEIIKDEVLSNEINSIIIHYSQSFYKSDINLTRMKAFVDLMREIGIKILFIAPVPVYDYHIPKMMLQLQNEPSSNFILTNYESYKIETENFDEFITKNNIGKENIWYTHSVFCPQFECAYQKDGVPYYFDSEHLTLTGAKQLQPIFNEISSQIISSR